MSLDQVESTVRSVVSHCLSIEPATLTSGTTWADVKADSLARIEITLALEDAFHLAIPHDVASGFRTLSDVVAYIGGRAEAPSSGSPP